MPIEMAVLEATFKATLDELKVPDEIQTALKDDGLLDKSACSRDVQMRLCLANGSLSG